MRAQALLHIQSCAYVPLNPTSGICSRFLLALSELDTQPRGASERPPVYKARSHAHTCDYSRCSMISSLGVIIQAKLHTEKI